MTPTIGRLAFGLGTTLSLAGALPGPARALEPAWPPGPYPYSVVSQGLPAVLKDFGENIGVRVSVSDDVKGTVKGTPGGQSARDFLNRLAHSYGFDWYYDGSVLAISMAQEERSDSAPLHGLGFDEARRKLTADGALDPRYVFRPGPTPDTAVVAGPPRYVDTVTHELAAAADPGPVLAPCSFVIHEGGKVTSYAGPNCSAQ